MAVVGTSETGSVEIICPACGENLHPQKAAVMIHCDFSPNVELLEIAEGKAIQQKQGFRAFLCQCGCVYSPMTEIARAEWERRHREQGAKLKEMEKESGDAGTKKAK